MARTITTKGATARERLLEAAYGLFSARGVARVGVDRIVTESGCAKSSLYNLFPSKEDLALAFLERREERWSEAWLMTEVRRRAPDAEGRLLAIFDVFDAWFRSEDFEGCAFVNVLLESDRGSRVHRAAAEHLARIRAFLAGCAREARLADPGAFAQAWHMLMKGSIVSACEGEPEAARLAQRAARLLLSSWPREA